nr:MAG TPA: hypothetical protein [Caudoviricetes sp.]
MPIFIEKSLILPISRIRFFKYFSRFIIYITTTIHE